MTDKKRVRKLLKIAKVVFKVQRKIQKLQRQVEKLGGFEEVNAVT